MVRAPFRLSFGGLSLVNRDRLRARCGQLERISLPGLVVAPPDRRSRLCPYLLQEPSFEKLGYGSLGRPRFGPAGGTRQRSSRCDAALSSTSCVSLNLMDMFEPSRFGSRPIPAPH